LSTTTPLECFLQKDRWGKIDGVQYIPSFKEESNRITQSNPIILHSVQRVYFTEEDWCDAYKLTDRKTIKKLRDKGKTNEEILEYYVNRRYLMAKGLDKKKNVKKKGKTLKEKRAAKKEKKRSFQVK